MLNAVIAENRSCQSDSIIDRVKLREWQGLALMAVLEMQEDEVSLVIKSTVLIYDAYSKVDETGHGVTAFSEALLGKNETVVIRG